MLALSRSSCRCSLLCTRRPHYCTRPAMHDAWFHSVRHRGSKAASTQCITELVLVKQGCVVSVTAAKSSCPVVFSQALYCCRNWMQHMPIPHSSLALVFGSLRVRFFDFYSGIWHHPTSLQQDPCPKPHAASSPALSAPAVAASPVAKPACTLLRMLADRLPGTVTSLTCSLTH